MTKQFEKYESRRAQGATALDAYRSAASDGVDQIACIKMLREVFGLSLDEAKKVSFFGDTGESLEAQQGKLVDEFAQILDELGRRSLPSGALSEIAAETD